MKPKKTIKRKKSLTKRQFRTNDSVELPEISTYFGLSAANNTMTVIAEDPFDNEMVSVACGNSSLPAEL